MSPSTATDTAAPHTSGYTDSYTHHTVSAEHLTLACSPTPPLAELIEALRIDIIAHRPNELQFDLRNAHAPLANALRRILIAEVPSVAIHDVTIYSNTTIFPDEYLAHRLGLVLIRADPEELGDGLLHFELRVTNDTHEDRCVYSDEIVYQPAAEHAGLAVQVLPGILICKLAPGHELQMDLSAQRGTGAEHAKWSPVALCSYRLMPRIELLRDFSGEAAEELRACFSPGVIEICEGRAVVANPRAEMMSREVFRHAALRDGVRLSREPCWFCFTVESLTEDPLVLVRRAVGILRRRCAELRDAVDACREAE